MSAQLSAARSVPAVLRAAWWAYPSRGLVKWLVMLSGPLALPGLLPRPWLAAVPPLLIVALMGMTLLTVVGVIGWMALLTNLLQQNDPQLARMVPGHVHALRLTLWSAAAALCAGGALFTSAVGGSLLAGVTLAALSCTGTAVVLRWPALFLPLMIVWLAPVPFARGTLLQAWQAAPLLATLAVVAAAAGVLHTAVLRGGARHERVHKRAVVRAALWRGDSAHASPAAQAGTGQGGPSWWLQPIARAYNASLRRGVHGPAMPRQRLALGLGPMLSVPGVLIGTAGAALIWVAMALVAWCFPQWELLLAIYWGMNVAVGTMVLPILMQWPTVLWATRREQALLRLLPGVPQGSALNRWLALRLSALQALTAALFLALFLALDALPGMPGQGNEVAEASVILSPLAVLTLWRDWSRMSAPQGGLSLFPLQVIAAVTATAYAWVAGAGLGIGLLAQLVLPAWLVLAAWRWRVLGNTPAAWPAGRLAGAPATVPVAAE